jgi:ankyrin repeat protein
MEMHRAAKAGDTLTVLSCIDGGSDIDSRDSLEATCLYWAVSKHHEDLVDILLERGADANAATKWGSTALHAAADRGFLKIAEKLLEYGADCNIGNNNNDTPLHMACMRGHLSVIQLLVLNGGAELSVRNLQGRTPRDEADNHAMTQAAVFLTTLMENARRRQGWIAV